MVRQNKGASWLTGRHRLAPKSRYQSLLDAWRPKGSAMRRTMLSAALGLMITACGQSKGPSDQNPQADFSARALSYINAGQYRAAHIEIRKASENDALTVAQRNELAYAKAQWFTNLGQHKGVIKVITEVPLENRTADMQLVLLQAYLRAGKLLSAEGILEPNKGPKIPESEAQYARAQIALTRRKPQEALELFTALNKALPESAAAQSANQNAIEDAPQTTTASNAASNPVGGTTQPKAVLSDLFVRTQLGIASSHLALRNTVGAEQVVDGLLERQDDLVMALLAKANLAIRQGRFETAEDALSTALIALPETDLMEPEKAQVLRAFVSILTRQGRTAEALTYSKILAEQNPEASGLKDQLVAALTLWREGKLEDAQKALLDLYKQAPNDRVGSLVGLISFLSGDQETANTYFERHLDAETANANMLMAMSRVFVEEGRMTETIELVEQAHRNNPRDGKITALLGALRLANGNAAGFAMMEEGLKQAPKQKQMWIALSQARQALQQDHQKAVQTLEVARGYYPEDVHIRRAFIAALLKGQQTAQAQKTVAGWIKAEGETLENLLLAANVALLKKNSRASLAFLEKARAQDPNNENVVSGITLATLMAGQYEKAKEFAAKLVEVKPKSPTSYLLYTKALGHLNQDRGEVMKQLQAIISQYDEAGGYVALFDFHMSASELAAAQAALQTARELSPGFDGLNERAARLAYRLGRDAIAARKFPEAREHLVHALKYMPNQQRLNTLLIRLELELGNVREAEKLILQLPEEGMDEKIKAQLNGELALKQGDYASAETMLLTAWKEQPTDALGRALYKAYLSQSKPVLTFLKDWQNNTNSNVATLFLGNELARSGNFKGSIVEYEKIKDYIAGNATALNNLAWSYQQVGDKRARSIAKTASELAPNDPAVLDTYGYILLQAGEKSEAKTILEKALNLDPDNAEIKAHWEQASR